MSRPNTLAQAAERIADGETPAKAVGEFLDMFYATDDSDDRLAALSNEPQHLATRQINALLGAVCEYLCKQNRLGSVPKWAAGVERFLPEPWFSTAEPSDGMREYLVFASPAEFATRNIFCESQPLRRASQQKSNRTNQPAP